MGSPKPGDRVLVEATVEATYRDGTMEVRWGSAWRWSVVPGDAVRPLPASPPVVVPVVKPDNLYTERLRAAWAKAAETPSESWTASPGMRVRLLGWNGRRAGLEMLPSMRLCVGDVSTINNVGRMIAVLSNGWAWPISAMRPVKGVPRG